MKENAPVRETVPKMPAPETFFVDPHADGVRCDGGGGALGHPVVWYSFDGAEQVTCGYCDRLFVKQK